MDVGGGFQCLIRDLQSSQMLSGPVKLGADVAPLGIPLYFKEKSRQLLVAETETSGGRVWKWWKWWWADLSLSIRVPVLVIHPPCHPGWSCFITMEV